MSTTDKVIPVSTALALILTMKMKMTMTLMNCKFLILMSPILIP